MVDQKLFSEISLLVKKHFEKKIQEFVPGKTKIPLAVPAYSSEEVIEAIDSLLNSWVTMGKKVQSFEEEFARYVGTKYAIMVNSGSSANLLSLAILTNPAFTSKLNFGDEVITPALTWATTVYPIVNNGLKPVFVDVDPETFVIDTDLIEKAISEKTKAIMPVHLLGNPANMDKIMDIAKQHNLFVIEDSCEAHGSEYSGKKIGSFGDLSTFSFFLSHHITTIEGGMVLTNNEEFFELGKSLRAFGWTRELKNKIEIEKRFPDINPKFLFSNLGFNLRPTEIQGGFGIHQIKKLEEFIQIRIDNANFWNKTLEKYSNYFQFPKIIPNTRNAFFGYSLVIKDNSPFSIQQFSSFLESCNIEVRPIMAGNMAEQPSSELYDFRVFEELKNSSYIMHNGLFLPNHHEIQQPQREYIAQVISKFIDDRIWEQ